MILENQQEIIQQALIAACFNSQFAFYQLTVRDIALLSEKLCEVMVENGFKIYADRDTKLKIKREKLELCETS